MHFIQIKGNMKKWLHVYTTIDAKITATKRLTSNSHHETALPQCSQRDFLSTHSFSMWWWRFFLFSCTPQLFSHSTQIWRHILEWSYHEGNYIILLYGKVKSWGKSKHSDWFLLGQDFAIWTVSKVMVRSMCIFGCKSLQIQNKQVWCIIISAI